MIMCYGPVVPDGYGVCYNPQKVSNADVGDKLLSPNVLVINFDVTL